METVLKVRVPGILMPWKEMMRGCLVVVLLGILCFCVWNDSVMYEVRQPDALQYALGQGKGCEAAEPVSVCREGHAHAMAVWKEADLSGFCVTMKLSAADMRKELAGFETGLSAEVRNVPVMNTLETGTFRTAAEPEYIWPEISWGLEDIADVPSVPPSVLDDSPTDMEWIEPVVPEDTPIMDTPDTTEENVFPEMPAISEEPALPEEIAGFLLDGEGYITGYTENAVVRDGLLVIPENDNCVGIRSGALDGLSESVMEVYLPANISDLEPGVFEVFLNLMFVEVSGDNPYYYSLDGILYSVSGEEICCPAGRIIE